MPSSLTFIEFPYTRDSTPYFLNLRTLPHVAWLDSGKSTSNGKRFDILSAAPIKTLSCSDIKEVEAINQNLFSNEKLDSIEECPFPGGVIGYLEYEACHSHFSLPNQGTGYWAFYDWALIQDHEEKRSYAVFLSTWNKENIAKRIALLKRKNPEHSPENSFSVTQFQKDVSVKSYQNAIEEIQKYILNGDCYQINFTQRFSAQFKGDPAIAYLKARDALPGPYSSFLDLGSHQVLSLSPEQFISIDDKYAQTKPIKGTIRRSSNTEQDSLLATELLKSEKNQSENLMIVDLLRNDFSKNCVAGSVKVPKLYSLESYANVHHLVSTVTGEIAPNVSASQFFEECFPGGSITGTPKKRAMEIINELESQPRKVYCGSIVSLGINGALQSNIAIRTLLIEDDKIYCWGGGGIVADSTVDDEYAESIQKIRVLLNALEQDS